MNRFDEVQKLAATYARQLQKTVKTLETIHRAQPEHFSPQMIADYEAAKAASEITSEKFRNLIGSISH